MLEYYFLLHLAVFYCVDKTCFTNISDAIFSHKLKQYSQVTYQRGNHHWKEMFKLLCFPVSIKVHSTIAHLLFFFFFNKGVKMEGFFSFFFLRGGVGCVVCSFGWLGFLSKL